MDQLARKWVYFSKVVIREIGLDRAKDYLDKASDCILYDTNSEENIIKDPMTPIDRDADKLARELTEAFNSE